MQHLPAQKIMEAEEGSGGSDADKDDDEWIKLSVRIERRKGRLDEQNRMRSAVMHETVLVGKQFVLRATLSQPC